MKAVSVAGLPMSASPMLVQLPGANNVIVLVSLSCTIWARRVSVQSPLVLS